MGVRIESNLIDVSNALDSKGRLLGVCSEWALGSWSYLPELGSPLLLDFCSTDRAVLCLSLQTQRIVLAAQPFADQLNHIDNLTDFEDSCSLVDGLREAVSGTGTNQLYFRGIQLGGSLQRSISTSSLKIDSMNVRPSPVWNPTRMRIGRTDNRNLRRLRSRHDVHVSFYRPVEYQIQEFVRRKICQWTLNDKADELSEIEKGPTFRKFLSNTCSRLGEIGLCRIWQMTVDEHVAAEQLHIGHEAAPYVISSWYDVRWSSLSPGRALFFLVGENMASAGICHVELGRGSQLYKYELGASDKWLVDVSFSIGRE